MKYDLVLRGGTVKDPKNKVSGHYDIGIKDGKVVEVAAGIAGSEAAEIVDVEGYTLMPGVVDPHVHVHGPAHRQMALAGVCTCLDMGAMRDVIKEMPARGCGLNVAGLQVIGPYDKETPSPAELAAKVEESLQGGAIGVKIVGGHNPSTPEATAAMIAAANKAGAYVAFHCGSTKYGSNLNGLLEAIELAGSNHLHIAHFNSYLRGMIKDPVDECQTAFAAYKGKKNLVAESYLAIVNGTGGAIGPDKLPRSHVTRNCLKMRGYTPDEAGLEKAIFEGYGLVQVEEGGITVFKVGPEGVAAWRKAGTNISMSFPVNQPMSTFLCAVKKYEGGEFIVDAISTDGGSTPRNVTVEHGLSLVRYKAITLEDFITKASTAGAAMLGLHDKGHLGAGADADITVLDIERHKAEMTVVGGKIVMAHGIVYGKGGTVVTTKKGVKAAEAVNLPYKVVDPLEMLIYTKSS